MDPHLDGLGRDLVCLDHRVGELADQLALEFDGTRALLDGDDGHDGLLISARRPGVSGRCRGVGTVHRRWARGPRGNFPFQPPDLLADRGLDDVQPFGGAAEVQLLGDGEEGADLAQLHAPGLRTARIDHDDGRRTNVRSRRPVRSRRLGRPGQDGRGRAEQQGRDGKALAMAMAKAKAKGGTRREGAAGSHGWPGTPGMIGARPGTLRLRFPCRPSRARVPPDPIARGAGSPHAPGGNIPWTPVAG
ncbi:hypothetical protein ABIA38_001455 [Embleya sp. AB8]